jgi:Flp pilus assembly pilin Flp
MINKRTLRSSKGQGITEYASIMAFVAIAILFAFSIVQGSLAVAVAQSYSSAAGQTNRLVAAASEGQIPAQ